MSQQASSCNKQTQTCSGVGEVGAHVLFISSPWLLGGRGSSLPCMPIRAWDILPLQCVNFKRTLPSELEGKEEPAVWKS